MTIITANYQKYLENKNFARASVKNYLCDAKNFTGWVSENNKEVSTLTPDDFTLYIEGLTAKSESPSTVNRRRTSLKLFVSYLEESGIISQKKSEALITPTHNLLAEYEKHLQSHKTPHNTIKNYLSDTRGYLNTVTSNSSVIPCLTRDPYKESGPRIRSGVTTVEYSPSTLARKQSSLKRFLEWAEKKGYVEKASPIPTSPVVIPAKAGMTGRWLGFLGIFIFTWSLVVFTLVAGKPEPKTTQVTIPVPVSKTKPTGKYIPFAGKIVNSEGYQVGETVPVVFSLYNAPTGGNIVWNSRQCLVGPEEDGSFAVTLGATNGVNFDCQSAEEIPSYLFYENTGLWLSMAINTDLEIDPRIPIATVANSQNTNTVDGYAASEAASENTIPVINEYGDLVLAATLPRLKSTSLGSSLMIEGQGGVVLASSDTSNSPITLNPDGSGNLNLLFEGASPISNGFVNASNANMANGALYYGEVGNDLSGYSLLDLRSGSALTSKFSVDASGNTTLAGNLTIGAIPSAGGTPLVVDEAGRIYKESSSTKYKTNIEDFTDDYKKILKLSPSRYQYLGRQEEEIGYLAENLDRMGLKTLVVYNALGEPEGIKYDKIPIYLIPIIKEQEEKLSSLFKLLSPIVDEQTISVEGKLTATEITAQKITADLITDSKGNKVVSEARVTEIEDYLKNSVTLDIDALKAITEQMVEDSQATNLNISDLFVTGRAVTTSLSISENLTLGTDLSISNNNINTLTNPLEIQSLAQAPVNIMGGKVTIATDGKVTAPQMEVKSLTTEVITVNNSQNISGHIILEAGLTEIEVVTPKALANSLVQLTPTTSTANNILYIKSKGEGKFTVAITQPATEPIEFDWLVIGVL